MNSFAYVKRWIDLSEVGFSERHKQFELIIFSVLGFFVPFFLGHPQLVVGAVVNAFLISAALKLGKYAVLPIVITPTLGVLSRGIIFGPYTPFLLYMIPFIWIGNYLLVYCFKKLNVQKKLNYWLTLGVGAGIKAGFLFAVASILFYFGIVPALFLTTMGSFQLITALMGGAVAFGYEKASRMIAPL
jgi:hypothetical protein